MKFKDILRSKRKELKLTQKDIADIWGIAHVNVSDWEAGRGMPEAGRIPALASRLGLSISELMGEAAPIAEDPPATYVERVDRVEMELLESYRLMSKDDRDRLMTVVREIPKIALPFRARNQG